MNLQERLTRLQNNLENFDLESFFHDETFFDILEDRENLEKNLKDLSAHQLNELFYIDRIIDSYYNIYKTKELKGYAKLSFDLMKDIEKIASAHLKDAA